MWKISLLDLCNDIKYSREYKPIMSSGLIDTFLMYIYSLNWVFAAIFI